MDTASSRSLPAHAASAPDPMARPATAGSADVLSTFRPNVYRVARWHLGPDDAEDVTQETLLRALRHRGEIRSPEAIWPWLRQITLNEVRRCLHALAAAPACAALSEQDVDEDETLDRPTAPDPQDVVFARLLADDLHRAIGQLTECQRSAVRLHYLEGMPLAEVGRHEGITVGAAKKRLADARAGLFRLLNPALAGGGGGRMKLRVTCCLLRRSVTCYGMGLLEDREAARVERHLARCDACRERARRVMAEDEAIRRAIRAAGPAIFDRTRRDTGSRRRFWSPAVALVAAAILAAALMLGIGRCGLPLCRQPAATAGCACNTQCGCSSSCSDRMGGH